MFARGRFGRTVSRSTQAFRRSTSRSSPARRATPARGRTSTTRRLKTSQAHRLGGLDVNKASEVLPHLYYPVFAAQADGKTAPNRLLWPAFWGRLSKGTVHAIAPERVKALMSKARVALKRRPTATGRALDNAMLARILRLLEREPRPRGRPSTSRAADCTGWTRPATSRPKTTRRPSRTCGRIAHDVRPASLALGARGCQDCHDAGAPIFFGQVAVDSPLASERGESWKMSRFQKNLDTAYVADFARSFRYRPWLKGRRHCRRAAILLLFVLGLHDAGARTAVGCDRR